MKNLFKRYDILLVILLFLLSLLAEYYEIFSLLEDQTVFFRHLVRSEMIDRKEMSFYRTNFSLISRLKRVRMRSGSFRNASFSNA